MDTNISKETEDKVNNFITRVILYLIAGFLGGIFWLPIFYAAAFLFFLELFLLFIVFYKENRKISGL